jgi:hypothetical protein
MQSDGAPVAITKLSTRPETPTNRWEKKGSPCQNPLLLAGTNAAERWGGLRGGGGVVKQNAPLHVGCPRGRGYAGASKEVNDRSGPLEKKDLPVADLPVNLSGKTVCEK